MYSRRKISPGIKKGFTAFEDILYVLVYLFAAALLIFVIYFTYQQIADPVSVALASSTNTTQTTYNFTRMSDEVSGGISTLNILFPFLLLGLIVMTAVSAMFIDSHPAFFFVSLIILGVVVLLGITFSNIYQQITENSNFGSTASDLSVMNVFMRNLPLVIFVIAIIVTIIVFTNSGGGYQRL